MSGKKSIIKTMIITLLFGIFFLVIGAVLYVTASAEKYKPEAPAGFVAVEAQVESVSEHEERGVILKNQRVNRIIYIAEVSFEYGGETIKSSVSGMPFLNAGDTAEILYNPRTGEVKASSDAIEGIFAAIAYAPAAVVTGIGVIIVLCAVISAVLKLSVFREKNRVCGVIAEVEENPNIIIDHKHPKIAICTFDEPGTGKRLRARSGNSTLDVFSMIGMNVPIYYNRRNPAKSFVDLENASGDLKLAEGQQRVCDLRNL